MSPQDYELTPPAKPVLLFPLFIGAILPLCVFTVLYLVVPAEGRRDMLSAMMMLLLMPLIGAGMAWNLLHLRVRLSDGGLRLRTLPFPRTLKLAELDLERAEIVDLKLRHELMPLIKIVGSRLPGYRAGRFRLRDKRYAQVLLTDLRKVLVLPKRNGGVVLLSMQRPEALLEAMRRQR
jgi:hypothetical protein